MLSNRWVISAGATWSKRLAQGYCISETRTCGLWIFKISGGRWGPAPTRVTRGALRQDGRCSRRRAAQPPALSSSSAAARQSLTALPAANTAPFPRGLLPGEPKEFEQFP